MWWGSLFRGTPAIVGFSFMSQGWIKLHRQICENELWLEETFSKSQAWIDLLLNANYEEKSFWVRGIETRVKRGQIAWSELTMAARWKWSRDKVRRFLKWLETRQQIIQQKSHITSLITIKNYNRYQETNTSDNTTDDTQLKNVKNVKKKEYTGPASKEALGVRIHTQGMTSLADIIKQRI